MKNSLNGVCVWNALIVLFMVSAVGCGSKNSADRLYAEISDTNIKRVCHLYTVFQGQHQFKGPKDEATLRAFVAEQDAGRLKHIGVDPTKLDQLFVSERDGQPFVFRWSLVGQARQAPVPIVFESTGVDGKYVVAFSSFICKEVEKPEYDRLLAGKTDQDSQSAERPDGR